MSVGRDDEARRQQEEIFRAAMGDDPHRFDLPYEEFERPSQIVMPPGTALAGGVIFRAAVVPAGGEKWPALLFDFTAPDGSQYPPMLLAMPIEQLLPLSDEIRKAVRSAVKGARKATS